MLAAIPAIAGFIGRAFVGYSAPFVGWIRWGIGKAFMYTIFSYIFSLIGVYIIGLIIYFLAPSFSSKKDNIQAMKLAVYSMTPAWVAGVLNIIPLLSFLVIIASLYGLYLLYLGISAPLLDTPKDKVLTYFIIIIVVSIIVLVVLGVILGSIFTAGYVIRTI
ncbi:YIP1 family protein [Candidatus Aminicenantes bacterium AH-873-B07]|nr:YIP1 family protein [Candidatus Aminicenantes bacterium AH-873-B07]